jgi:hypothetical protein
MTKHHDGHSFASIKQASTGHRLIGSENPPAGHHAVGHVPESNKSQQRLERTGEFIESNNPRLATPRAHPTESHEIGPGSMDRPLKSGPAWKSAERVLKANRVQHNPTGKTDRGNLNRGPVITK